MKDYLRKLYVINHTVMEKNAFKIGHGGIKP
jgi:hypothetical protein